MKEEGREGKEAGDKGGREEETEGVYNPIIYNFQICSLTVLFWLLI